jgi:DNA-binding XRE family transcriptional regulator
MGPVAKKYRNRVKECRLRAMVGKQEELSRLTGINRSTISALENNRLFLSSHYALLIAEALKCKLDDLFERVDGDIEKPY